MTMDVRQAARLLEEALASGVTEREVAVGDGRRLLFRRAPAPGLAYSLSTLSTDGEEGRFQEQYEAAGERPAGYPADAPFLPYLPVSVVWAGERWGGIAWEDVDDIEAFAAALSTESARDGWVTDEQPLMRTGDGPAVEMWVMRRADAQRVLTVTRGAGRAGATLMAAPGA